MSSGELENEASLTATDLDGEEAESSQEVTGQDGPEQAAKPRLDLDVHIKDLGSCKKHIKVSVPRVDIDRQFNDSLGTIQKDAQVPGFRPGRAPRQLVIKRFRKQVAEQVKSALLMSALEQIDEDYQLNPISQPKLDIEAIVLPEEGPLSFELEVEVRPELKLPDYKGLKAKRPIRKISDADVEQQLERFLERHGQIVPKFEGSAQIGDFITADITFLREDGTTLSKAEEVQFRLQPELRFQDGTMPDIGKALEGAKPGETRDVEGRIGSSAADASLRNKSVKVQIQVKDLKQLRLPDLTPAFLNSIGVDSLEDLHTGLREILDRRVAAQQKQVVRSQILDQLIAAAPFDLPADLVSRQEKSTLQRLVMELRQEGFTDKDIKAREAEIRANAHEITLRSLKEFFLLAKIAEVEEIKVEDVDLEMEIEAIAARSDESVRRVRSRIEKEGMGDALATQILERKALDRILESVEFEDIVLDQPEKAVETLDQSAAPPLEGEPEAGEGGEESPRGEAE